jgi:hypothetical protein
VVQCSYRERFCDAAYFRETSSDKKSRVSLIKKASSSAAENVMAIVLGHFQSVFQRPETKYLRRETFVGFPAWVWIWTCHCDII